LVLAILIFKFQVVELVFTMGVFLNGEGTPHPPAGVLSMEEFLRLLNAASFQLLYSPVVFSDLALSSKARIIRT